MEIIIPKLNEMAYEQVELASVPFLTFIANKDPKGDAAKYSFVLRGYVRHWLGNVWGEYDRIKLKDIVANPPAVTEGKRACATRPRVAARPDRGANMARDCRDRPMEDCRMMRPAPLYIVASRRQRARQDTSGAAAD